MAFRKVALIGLGLIGSSFGLALRRKHPKLVVEGYDASPEVIREAQKREVIVRGSLHPRDIVTGADLVIMAVPVSRMEPAARQIAPFLNEGVIVTDVGSTKEKTVRSLEAILPPGVRFVGGHPMAGSEKSGPAGASELLLENAAYILTPTAQTDLDALRQVKDLVESLGAKVLLLSPADHDKKVAAVSHLPHVLASALVHMVGQQEEKEGGYFALAAGGFRDVTRIAGSQGELWVDILLENRAALLPLLEEFGRILGEFGKPLAAGDKEQLLELLTRSRVWREKSMD